MIIAQREGRSQRSSRRSSSLILPFTLAVLLLIPAQGANAAAGVSSGTAHLSNTLEYGNTAYSIDYSHPAAVQVGKNLTVTLYLHVDSMTGLVEYIISYKMIASLFIGAQYVANGSILASLNDPNLYPGAVWGPKNVTIPITAANTGLAQGATANGTVIVTLDDTIRYGGQLQIYITEPAMQGDAGAVLIQNSPITTTSGTGQATGQSQSYVPYLLLASGVVLMLAAVFLPRVSRPTT